MLPAAHRVRRSADFASIVRTGRRARSGPIVVHRAAPDGSGAARVGLIVGRAVGGSVDRHRVSRRLRAQLAQRLDRLPAGSATVVRALPGAGSASSAEFGSALDIALTRLEASS